MSPGFHSVHGHYLFGDNDVKTTFKFGLNDDLKVKLHHSKVSNSLEGEVEGDNWEAKYNFATQDFKYEFSREVAPGKLKIKQHIPGGKWQLLPSPHVQLTTSLLKEGDNKVLTKDRLKIGYDFQLSAAEFEGAVWLDNNVKFKLEADTKTELNGAVFGLSTKHDGVVSKLGLKYNTIAGPSVVATLKGFDDQVKVKAHAYLQQKTLDAHFKIKHPGWEKSELHLETKVPFSGSPSMVSVGVHYDV